MIASSGPGGFLSAAELGEIVGLHERQVRKLAERSIIERDGRGRYELAPALRAYCAHLREQAAGRTAGGEDGDAPVIAQERALLIRTQREGHELRNQVLRGDLLAVADAEETYGAVAIAIRQRMLALPTKAAPLCVGLQDLARLRDTLTELVHDALSDLAAADVVTAGLGDRARGGFGAGAEAAAAAEAAAPPDGEPMGG